MNDSDLINHLRDQNEVLQARIEELEEALVGTFLLPVEWCLTKHEERLMALLINRESITKIGAMAVLYDDLGKDRPEEKIIDVLVCKIRAKLKPFDITIKTHWGLGFYIEKEKRLVLKQQLEGGNDET
ncbi:hypothetical protein GCM10007094_23260 [Pseudovibrio japonicus]|uniref:OmpR/PhoB-type domain-containing protein n=1 Tax=Pseudovibrio japonicus TaxID=366534 RepID=A0ABQ3EEG5_9HYPH|nr:helix-turn-helix domain-containing protein [Pseudovibrio japonicus]GHB33756.1 hypothetical protein GCM10007094_23260 [Pseudovibrio japonicus]